ncbi:uncharacterized protein LOC112030837 [Quercus suber]|uniref:uncharacterized protein LOC112030837 n=1 Tax=Quercus suber TaxID=58331 RepID=UPI000CE201E9|nr:uncharacterized protein LOC112027464 [Quercus suber]
MAVGDRVKMLLLLLRNVDVFAWSPYEVPGVDSEFIVHKLNVDSSYPPKKQRPRRSSKEHTEAVKEEVQRLKESGAIKETYFPEWLANTVVVKKKSGKWRVCVDFTDLNRACPKDPFPVPKIDQLVDATYGHPRMSFLDAFQGYHQIALAAEDQEKTAFISPEANYHYTVMPFGLKNAGATYQRMMTRMFRDKIGCTVEVYIDDMVVKSKLEEQHTGDLQEVFETLRRHKLRLNAEKCAFGVGAGKFLGYLITSRGIEVNPDQIEAIKRLKPPSNPKEVQVLTGMLAALNRFVSKFADRCRPFYQLLKKWTGFLWSEECDKAFRDLKEYLARAPMLAAPEPGEDLFMYLAVSDHAVSAVLLKDGGIQQPVYYISKTLVDAEKRYLPLEKLVLALIHATRKLPHYFQAHTVYVLTEYPLQALLRRSDFTGRIAKWGTRLGSFDIRYRPRHAVKGQVLADFVAEFSPRNGGEMICQVEVRPWKVFVDGASSSQGAGAGIVIFSPEGLRLEHSFRLGFKASNNEAEYEALIAGLRAALKLGARSVEIHSDSRLVVSQIQGSFEARDPRMKAYLCTTKMIISKFVSVKVSQVGRAQNRHADSLATLASSSIENVPRLIRVELVAEPSIQVPDEVGIRLHNVDTVPPPAPCWIDPIIAFLSKDVVPEDEKEASRIRRTAPRFWLSADGRLYRRSFGGPYLLCLPPERVPEILAELHDGICGSHVGGRSLAHRAMTQGFWWPKMQRDAADYALRCDQCQKHAPLIHQPAGQLNPISRPWPFAQWGLDILGPFPRATGNRRFVIVAVDYFTKWAEAEALANIRDTDVKKFVWKNIVTRFGVPESLISDNGLQFDSRAFRTFCNDLGIKNKYSTPAYPQSNGLAEATNKVILNGLKKRLDGAKGGWAEELPNVLWAYRTTPRRSTGESPFSLTYGSEAVIPTEVKLCSARVAGFDPEQNDEMMIGLLDSLEERREKATVRLAEYQQKLAARYNRGVRLRGFSAGDMVLRRAVGSMRDTNSGKLAQTWEGPYRVTAVAGAGAYYLEDLEERPLPRPWNVHNLKKFYH